MQPNVQEKAKILVIDDDSGVRDALELILEDKYDVATAKDGQSGIEVLRENPYDLVLLDITMPGMDGFEVLRDIRGLDESRRVIMVSAIDRAKEAVEAVKLGALDYITKPFDGDDVLSLVEGHLKGVGLNCATEKHSLYLQEPDYRQIISQSSKIFELFDKIEKVAKTSCSVLITGESGTGKELVASLIHKRSDRSAEPFLAINCAALPPELLESELFGHEKGAFTGAYTRKVGKFEYAKGGTLFLDELSSLRIDLQAKMLRVLQEQEFSRIGGHKVVKTDIRLIGASNIPLEDMIAEGKFREDLFYRLNVIPLYVPPLRERKGDVALLAEHFLKHFAQKYQRPMRGISPDALAVLEQYPWPGNVRELKNFIERSLLLSPEKQYIEEGDLPLDLLFPRLADASREKGTPSAKGLLKVRENFERQYILRSLENCGWNQSATARMLRIHRNTLLKRMKVLNINPGEMGESKQTKPAGPA